MMVIETNSFIPFAKPEPVPPKAASLVEVPVAAVKPDIISDLCIVLVVENTAECAALTALLQRSTMFRAQVYQAQDLDAALELTKRYRPDVVVLDSLLPHGHVRQEAVTSMRALARVAPETAFIIVAGEEDQAAAVYALQEGAYDYLLKDQIHRDAVNLYRSTKNAVQRKQLEREFQRTVEILRERNRELELLNQQLWKLSHTDELTGYFNRRHIMSRLEEEVSRGTRYNSPLSVILADIDHFKRINDTFGHLAGDSALKAIADLFRSKLRESDLIGRFGGEEFLLILPHTDLAGAEAFCHRLRDYVEKQPVQLTEQTVHITSSFGLACLTPETNDVQKLLRVADRNLYRAKSSGRNRVVADMGLSDTVPMSSLEWNALPKQQETKVIASLRSAKSI